MPPAPGTQVKPRVPKERADRPGTSRVDPGPSISARATRVVADEAAGSQQGGWVGDTLSVPAQVQLDDPCSSGGLRRGDGSRSALIWQCDMAEPRDPLLVVADDVRGKKAENGHAIKVVTEMTTPSGRKFYGHNGQKNANIEGLVNDYISATGNKRHMKCAELHCISQAVHEGVEFRGSTMRSVTVDDAFGKSHGTPMAPCDGHCRLFLPWLDITANPSTFPADW